MIGRDAEEHARRATEDMERRLAIMKKAARLDIAARLYASMLGTHNGPVGTETARNLRTGSLVEAELLIAENEARP